TTPIFAPARSNIDLREAAVPSQTRHRSPHGGFAAGARRVNADLINAPPVLRDMKRTRRQFVSGAIVEVVPAGVRGGDFVLNILGARECVAISCLYLLINGYICV